MFEYKIFTITVKKADGSDSHQDVIARTKWGAKGDKIVDVKKKEGGNKLF